MSAPSVRAAYRAVLRAQRIAFRGDTDMIGAMQVAARGEFDKGSAVVLADNLSVAEVELRLREAHEAAEFLRNNVVQAPLNTRGNYEVDVGRIRTDKAGK